MSMRTTLSLRKRLIPILGMLAIAALFTLAKAQGVADSTAIASEGTSLTQQGIQYWQDCGLPFQILLGLCMLAGLLVGVSTWFWAWRQNAQEATLREAIDSDMSTLKDLVDKANMLKGNLFSRLILLVDKVIRHKQHERLDSLLESYRTNEENDMRRFTRWMMYLSTSAGALGLLGTVHGIYTTFASGTFTKTAALDGMAIALATTFVGLVISLILDLLLSFLNTYREKRVALNLSKAEELKIIAFDAVSKKE